MYINIGEGATPPSKESIEKSEPERVLCDNTEKSPEKSEAIGKIFEAPEKSPEKSDEGTTPENLEVSEENPEPAEKPHIHSWVGNIPIIIPRRVKQATAEEAVEEGSKVLILPLQKEGRVAVRYSDGRYCVEWNEGGSTISQIFTAQELQRCASLASQVF